MVTTASHNVAPRLALQCANSICLFISQNIPFLWNYIDTLLLFSVSVVRLASGINVAKGIEKSTRPEQPLILYDSQTDPDSRLVRETLSVLDIDYVCYPCPKESMSRDKQPLNSRFRPQLIKTGGLLKIPLLVDPNKSVKLYLADTINQYLWKTYGDKAIPSKNYTLAHYPAFRHISLFVCQLLRPSMSMGVLRAPSHRPEKPLELFAFASSPFVQRVCEVLCSLELPYVMRSVAKGSPKRDAFRTQELDKIPNFNTRPAGKVQVPMLRDPNNNDIRILESTLIVDYLTTRYQTYPIDMSASWLESDGADPVFTSSTAAIAAVLACIAPPLLAFTYAAAAIFRIV